MVIIAFSEKTSKILPRILCRHFRHCAPIFCNNDNLIMYQFINKNHIEKISLNARDISILQAHGWQFVYISPCTSNYHFDFSRAYSCVDLSKRAIGVRSIFIQTPYALYKYLVKK